MDAKTQRGTPPGAPRYHRLTNEKRIKIETLRKEGLSRRGIAQRLGCSPSTVGRELKRNRGKRGYRAKKAQAKAAYRARAKAEGRRKLSPEIWAYAKERLALGWTFEEISGRAKKEKRPTVGKETLYKEYYARQRLVKAGKSDEDLPPLPMRRKERKCRDRNAKKYRSAGRGRIPGRVDIDERPASVESRARGGHWEGDLINGSAGTGHLVTLVERMTRFTLFVRVASKEAGPVAGAVIGLLAALPKGILGTLTFDNGKEFALFKAMEQALGLKVYFAKPYHSWERGTNENRNGVVRRVLPKGRSFGDVTEEEMRRIDSLLNDRPLKCLNWRTPREAFAGLVRRHLVKAAA